MSNRRSLPELDLEFARLNLSSQVLISLVETHVLKPIMSWNQLRLETNLYSFQFKLNVHLMQIQATLALETNCGHVYCGNCILEVKISREKCCLLVGPSQMSKGKKSKQSCAEMLLSGVAAKQCTASNGMPILPSKNHNHPPIFLPGTQLSRPYMLNRQFY